MKKFEIYTFFEVMEVRRLIKSCWKLQRIMDRFFSIQLANAV